MRVVGALVGIGLLVSTAFAHTTLFYDGTQPLAIRARPGHPVQITFPAGITDMVTALPKDMIELDVSKTEPKRIGVHAVSEKIQGAVHVNTVTGQSYVVALSAYVGEIDPIITVADTPTEQPGETAIPAGHKPAPRDAIRQLWFAQWGTQAGITVTPLQENLLTTPEQKIDLIAHYQGRGYYGFTQRITNTSSSVKRLWLPGLYDPYARLFSASLDGHTPPLKPDQQAETLYPGQSVLLHLVYETVR